MTKIVAAPNRKVFQKDEWYLFYDPNNVKWVKVNNDGEKIISVLEKNTILEEAIDELKQTFKVDENTIYKFVDFLVEHAKYFQKGTYNQETFHFPHKSIYPKILYIHPTYRCNLNCVYCYNSKERNRYSNAAGFSELTMDDYRKLFYEAKEIGVKELIYSGGEPILRKDLFTIAEISKEMGFRNSIITNGTLITTDNVYKIKELFHHISVSIDSYIASENDAMRGKGAFRRALRGIRLLLSLHANVSCLGVSHKGNIHSVAKSWDFFVKELGCNSYIPQAYIPKNDAITDDRAFKDYVNEYGDLRCTINKKNGIIGPISLKNGCGMCSGELAVGADGKVFPCQSLLKEEFCGGNIKKDSLKNILENSTILEYIRNFTVDQIEGCADCEVKYLCGGGCRALHYEINRDLKKNCTTHCKISKKIIIGTMFESAILSNKGKSGHYSDSQPQGESKCF